MNIDDTKAELGEGVFWDASREVLYWLDINNSMLLVGLGLTTGVIWVNNCKLPFSP